MAKKSLEYLLNTASEASEPSNEGDYKAYVDGTPTVKTETSGNAALEEYKKKQEEKRLSMQEQIDKAVPTIEELEEKAEEPKKVEVKKDTDVSPARDYVSRQSKKTLGSIPSAEFLQGIVELSDMIRDLPPTEDKVLKSFLKIKQDEDLGTVIEGALMSDTSRSTALINLCELHSEEQASMAFSIVALSDNELKSLSDVLILFKEDYEPGSLTENKIDYCRRVQSAITHFPTDILESLVRVSEILAAALEIVKL